MWIPYDLRGLLVPEPRGEGARRSAADRSLRGFFVGVWLKNPITQHWETDLSIPLDPPEANLAGPYGPAQITFHANVAGRLAEVLCELDATSASEAVEATLSLLSPRLLALGARVGRGVGIAAWQVLDIENGQKFRASANRPSTLDAHSTWLIAEPDPELQPAMLMCQRARASADAASRLIAACSALDHMLTSPAFAKSQAAELRISEQNLLNASARTSCSGLAGSSYAEFRQYLGTWVARLMSSDGLWRPLPLEEVDTPHIAALANLADLIAHRMMTTELKARERSSEDAAELIG